MKKILIWLFIMLMLPVELSIAQNGKTFKIIVHSSNPVKVLKKKNISKIFLKKIRKWDGGKAISPVDLVEPANIREKFSKYIHGKKNSSIKAFWQKQIFSGRSVPPPEMGSPAEVVAYVSEHPYAIGYIPDNFSIRNFKVKTIQIEK